MKKRNRYFVISGLVLLLIILTGFGFAGAWGPARSFPPCFRGGGFHPGPPGKGFSEFLFWRLDNRVKGLDLTSAQQEKYGEIIGEIRVELREATDDRKKLIEELRAEIEKEDPDMKALTESVKNRLAHISVLMQGNLDRFAEFYKILDDNQKDEVIRAIREKFEQHGT